MYFFILILHEKKIKFSKFQKILLPYDYIKLTMLLKKKCMFNINEYIRGVPKKLEAALVFLSIEEICRKCKLQEC